jgi:tRNA pseudouridine55 synthase
MARHRKGRPVHGILLLDKPQGATSNRALQQAKRALNAQKAGHTGSLDPLATGLLPLCFGHGTKVSAYLLDADKTYDAELNFGCTTTTGDSEGEICEEFSTAHLSEKLIQQALDRFLGEIEQVPPMYSALKQNGQPLYKLARQGIEVPRQSRAVTIFALERIYLTGVRLGVRVHCSKGTYIRTLAEDIAKSLNCGAHLTKLRRTSVGPFGIDGAVTLEQLGSAGADDGANDNLLLPLDSALNHLPAVELSADLAQQVTHGISVNVESSAAKGMVRIYEHGQRFLGVGEIIDNGLVAPRRIMCESG